MTTSILHPSRELMSLIVAHPDLPIVYIYGDGNEPEGVAEHVRCSATKIILYKDEYFTDKDDLEEAIEYELFEADYSEDSNDLYIEATLRAEKRWCEAQPCILVEVW